MSSSISQADIERFIKDKQEEGRSPQEIENLTNGIIRVLALRKPFVDALMSNGGRALLSDAEEQMNMILDKIKKGLQNNDDLAEYRAYHRILERWRKILDTYTAALGQMIK